SGRVVRSKNFPTWPSIDGRSSSKANGARHESLAAASPHGGGGCDPRLLLRGWQLRRSSPKIRFRGCERRSQAPGRTRTADGHDARCFEDGTIGANADGRAVLVAAGRDRQPKIVTRRPRRGVWRDRKTLDGGDPSRRSRKLFPECP